MTLKNSKNVFQRFYEKQYKVLMIIPLALLLVSFFLIYQAVSTDGTPIYRDISLKGGLSSNFYVSSELGAVALEKELLSEFALNEFKVSGISDEAESVGYAIDTNLDESELKSFLSTRFNVELNEENYMSNYVSPTLSQSFFKQFVILMIISFVLMSFVVFLYFREFVPGVAVVLSAFFDIVVTVGVLNFMNFKLSIAGLGTLLMLIGYSIDTDILLTNRLLKEEGKKYFAKVYESMTTGLVMTSTTFVAGLIALIFTNSDIIREIALVLVIGLLVDVVSTWIQNTGILLSWLNSKE